MTDNMLVVLLLGMILAHLISDYCLQGWLASAKQKSWWEKNAPDGMYSRDYIAALVCHSTMWALCVYIPLVAYAMINGVELTWFWGTLPINIAFHCFVDDLKANKHKINLCQDQLLHAIQIVLTLMLFWIRIGG